jgi:hypothetical protein
MFLLLAEFQSRFEAEPERVGHRVQEDLSYVVSLLNPLGPDFEKALGHVEEGFSLDVPELQPFEVLGHIGDESLDALDVSNADQQTGPMPSLRDKSSVNVRPHT